MQWNRNDAIASIADRLWRYLTARATVAPIPAVLEQLWKLPPGSIRRLGATYLGLHPATAAMLDDAARVLREMPSSAQPEEQLSRAALRGRVLWAKTIHRQRTSSHTNEFVTRNAHRSFDTALGQLLVLALTECASLSGESLLTADAPGVGRTVGETSAEARRLLRHTKLQDVRKVRSIDETVLSDLSRRRNVTSIVNFVRLYRDAVRDLAPTRVRNIMKTQLLTPATEDRLFELMVGFSLVDALCARGFRERRVWLVGDPGFPFAELINEGQRLRVYWQRAVGQLVPELPVESFFSSVLRAAQMSASSLRPDFVILRDEPFSVLMVEVKHTLNQKTSERRGIVEMLAYLKDCEEVLSGLPRPVGLVVAWGATGRPSLNDVMVADFPDIPAAVDTMLLGWGAGPRDSAFG